jgi:hypothetical protein
MGLSLWQVLPRGGLLVAVPVAGMVYTIALIGLGALGEDERMLLRRLVPKRFQRI